MKRVTQGPRYATVNYTVQRHGGQGFSVLSTPALAASQVACLRENYPGAVIDVTYSEHCAHCNGAGRTLTNPRQLTWKPCKACNGQPELFSRPFEPSEIADMMRRNQSAWLAA